MIVIAELGSNPAPDWYFDQYLGAATRSGATHAKVQIFHCSHFPEEERAEKHAVEFPRHRVQEFVEMAHFHNLQAGASVFDAEAVELAAEHCDFLKIAAREVGNEKLFDKVAATGKPFYFSFNDRAKAPMWRFILRGAITPMRTISKYPAGLIRSIMALRDMSFFFDGRGPWGWSSHTRSIWDCVLAARWGASVIEKHMCLGDGRNEPEAGWSLTPAQFAAMTARMGR